ncbi:chitin elicitor receptor kinase 1-like [Triticum dicoccoides]|uniref:chitin elicitor receptor kinase 1-like n=1 Tax=Triticum dicoccoides TaxID=85692 RepID=UPI000E7C94D2|nr:chitin elicitor receptor kinase 1-like [Triticum dicoccoides]
MCKSSSHALPSTTTTVPSSSRRRRRSPSTTTATATASSSAATASTSSGPRHTTHTSTATTNTASSSSTSSRSSRSSLAAARASLPDQPVLYTFHELAAATNNFLAKRGASDITFWRCSLRSRPAALFQLHPLPGGLLTPAAASAALARVARYHHASLARLLGACPAGAHVYLAYALPTGACTLAAYLSSSRAGGSSTSVILRTWLSRVQVAVDVAQGIEYAHAHADAAHGRISPSAVLLVPDAHGGQGVRAVLTHFGAGHFAAPDDGDADNQERPSKGKASDVRAFGVLLLGLLSGEGAESRYRFDRATKEFARVSVVDTAAEAVRTGRVRSWVDRRLGDSFPVAAAERLVEVGLRCAADEDSERPEMAWVAGKVSRVYVESRAWERTLQPPSDDLSSVALAPR